MTRAPAPAALLGAAHPGPALAVTVLAGLLGLAWGAGAVAIALVVGSVLTSQLSIGWSNDLLDLRRDVAVGRTDKPLATGALPVGVVRAACVVAVVVTVPLGLACGLGAGLVHVVNTAAGWAYNLGLKATVLSAVPYVVAFGGLPLFVGLADPATGPIRVWAIPAGALLGLAAHVLNVLPDLAEDAAAGVHGLPHRLGRGPSRVLVAVCVASAAALVLLGAQPSVPLVAVVLAVVAALVVVAR